MKTKKIMALTSMISVAVTALVVSQLFSNVNLARSASASLANTVSITRTTTWVGNYDTSDVTAITAKGNELEFGAANFDIRNGEGNWNNCVVSRAKGAASVSLT